MLRWNLPELFSCAAVPAIRWRIDPPMSAGAPMNLSTIMLAFNAQLVRHLKLGH
jgi:hypothetical protein